MAAPSPHPLPAELVDLRERVRAFIRETVIPAEPAPGDRMPEETRLALQAEARAAGVFAPHARADVALCLAALLADLGEHGAAELDLDNHPTDPHTAPLLATLDRTEVDPVHLVEIPNGLTAVLRELP